MNRRWTPSSPLWLWAPALIALTTSCIDTEQVFVQKPPYEDPAAAAQGFLGYSDLQNRTPICGSCHVGKLTEWKQTRHASAWNDLQASGEAEEFCEGCHTVGANGNTVTDPNVGWAATGDPRYQDVQCESCHGPGLDHVTNPDAGQPIAPLLVGLDLTSGCGECHQGAHTPFVDEWAQSRHGDMLSFPQRIPECVQCHEARGAFAAWGVNTVFLEQDQKDPIPITCAVCHDPHDATNEHQLRFPIDVPNSDINLCMKCHQRTAEPDPDSNAPPHSPQGPLLLGDAGWRPRDFTSPTEQIVGSHGTEANPELCATCHVSSFTVTDPASGDFVFRATGHLFRATPCLDAKGIPTTGNCDASRRTYEACATGGCHTDADAARTAQSVARARIDRLADELHALVNQAPSTEFRSGDHHITTAEGARFNYSLARMKGSEVHNPFLLEALLTSSIQQVMDDYGVRQTSDVRLDNVLGSHR